MKPRAGYAWLVWGAAALGLAGVAASAWSPYTFLKGDSGSYVIMDRALLDSGWLEMSAYHPMSWYKGGLPHFRDMDQAWSNLSLGADGQTYYPKQPWLLAVFALPLYALFGPNGVLIFNVLAAAAILACAYVVARRFAGQSAALVATLPVALSGLMLDNTYAFSNDIFYTALLGVGLVTLIAQNRGVSAFFFGCAVVAKPTNVIWLPLPFVAVAWDVLESWRGGNHRALFPPPLDLIRPMARPAIAAASVLLAAATMNMVMFGSPLKSGYHSVIIATHGTIGVDSAAAAFHQPFWRGLRDQISDDRRGLWPRGMILAASAFVGLLGVRRIGPAALLPLLVLGVYLLVHAQYDYVWARFYLPCLLLSPLGLAAPFGRSEAAPAWRGLRSARAVSIIVVAALLVWALCVGVGRFVHLPGARHDLADRIASATVTRVAGGRTTPCDYLNPTNQHWECSRLEVHDWQGWGADVRRQCTFSRWAGDAPNNKPIKAVSGMLFLQPASVGVRKRIVFDDLGPLRDFSLLLGYTDAARGLDAKVRITLNGVAVPLPTLQRAGTLHLIGLGDKTARHGPNRLEIEVEAAQHSDWRQLCVGAWLHR